MGMHMGGPPGMRSFFRDSSVTKHKVVKGTGRRMMRFAAPYKRLLTVFLVMIVLDALLGAAEPADLPLDHQQRHHRQGLAAWSSKLALLVAVLAIVDAAPVARRALGVGHASARASSSTCARRCSRHVQRMPLAFFTRTQTGALVTRLNNDVLGAQQAFTDTPRPAWSSNLISVAIALGAMFVLSWQITLVALVCCRSSCCRPAGSVGKLSSITRECYASERRDEHHHDRALQRVRARCWSSSSAGPTTRRASFERPGRPGARHRRHAGDVQPGVLRLAHAHRVARHGARLRLGRRAGRQRCARAWARSWRCTAYLTRLYGPLTALSNVQVDVMTALVSFERVFEVLDLPPMIDREARRGRHPARAVARVEFDHVDFGYPTADEVSLASLESVAVLDQAPHASRCCSTSTSRPSRGQLVALVGPSGAGKTTISQLVPRLYDVRGGAVRINGVDVRDATLASLRDAIGVVTQDAHLFHETIRVEPALRQARRHRRRDRRRAARRPDPAAASTSLPDGLDTVVGDRGYRLSGGEKQRHRHRPAAARRRPTSWCSTRPPRTSTPSPRPPCRRRSTTALAGRTSHRHRPPALDRARRRPDPGRRRRAHRASAARHDELLAAGGALRASSTAPSSSARKRWRDRRLRRSDGRSSGPQGSSSGRRSLGGRMCGCGRTT